MIDCTLHAPLVSVRTIGPLIARFNTCAWLTFSPYRSLIANYTRCRSSSMIADQEENWDGERGADDITRDCWKCKQIKRDGLGDQICTYRSLYLWKIEGNIICDLKIGTGMCGLLNRLHLGWFCLWIERAVWWENKLIHIEKGWRGWGRGDLLFCKQDWKFELVCFVMCCILTKALFQNSALASAWAPLSILEQRVYCTVIGTSNGAWSRRWSQRRT